MDVNSLREDTNADIRNKADTADVTTTTTLIHVHKQDVALRIFLSFLVLITTDTYGVTVLVIRTAQNTSLPTYYLRVIPTKIVHKVLATMLLHHQDATNADLQEATTVALQEAMIKATIATLQREEILVPPLDSNNIEVILATIATELQAITTTTTSMVDVKINTCTTIRTRKIDTFISTLPNNRTTTATTIPIKSKTSSTTTTDYVKITTILVHNAMILLPTMIKNKIRTAIG